MDFPSLYTFIDITHISIYEMIIIKQEEVMNFRGSRWSMGKIRGRRRGGNYVSKGIMHEILKE